MKASLALGRAISHSFPFTTECYKFKACVLAYVCPLYPLPKERAILMNFTKLKNTGHFLLLFFFNCVLIKCQVFKLLSIAS